MPTSNNSILLSWGDTVRYSFVGVCAETFVIFMSPSQVADIVRKFKDEVQGGRICLGLVG